MARPLASITTTACAILLSACAARTPAPARPPLALAPAWKTLLGDFVEPPLASDGRRIFVATRDGVVRALDVATGEVLWKVDGIAGRLSAAEGTLLLRDPAGGLTSLHPRTGAARWTIATAVPGELPAVIDDDRAYVAGEGLAAVELSTGRLLWTQREGGALSAPPVRAGTHVLTGGADGTLRCRDRENGAALWSTPTKGALLAPPLVDLGRHRAYLGTTDRRILEIDLATGDRGWRWRVGADIAQPGLLQPERVLFASYDAVLYALRRGGNLAWRAGLPSRPLSGPLLVADYVIVACLENDIAVFDPNLGTSLAVLRTSSEIRTPPLPVGSVLAVGLRDRSVIGFTLPGPAPAAPATVAAPSP